MKHRTQRGHALTETLLIASFAAAALAAIPALGEYGTKALQTQASAKLLAWQRNVWLAENHGIPTTEAEGASGAIKKTDAEVTRDLRRHIFRDRTVDVASVHAADMAEFEPGVPAIDKRTTEIKAASTAVALPSLLNASDTLWDNIRIAQAGMSGNAVTQSLGKFTFVSGGYLRNQVDVKHTQTLFRPMPEIDISAQVTMLTEAWNAGGTMREEKKIQGLVPMKMADAPFYQDLRNTLHQTAFQIKQVFPTFDNSNLTMGLQPGDANEYTPLDRFEKVPPGEEAGDTTGTADLAGGAPTDRFRYYRSFPPPPVVNTLP